MRSLIGLLTGLHLDHFLDRHQDLSELLADVRALDPLDERALDALLETRVGVHDKPLLGPAALITRPSR